mgnify:FL=1
MIITKNLLESVVLTAELSRLCIHESPACPLQVMVLVLAPNASYPMHYHKTRSEFYWILEGELEIALVKQNGLITKAILSPSKNPGFLMDVGVHHSVKNKSDKLSCRFLEIRPGPFEPLDNVRL